MSKWMKICSANLGNSTILCVCVCISKMSLSAWRFIILLILKNEYSQYALNLYVCFHLIHIKRNVNKFKLLYLDWINCDFPWCDIDIC